MEVELKLKKSHHLNLFLVRAPRKREMCCSSVEERRHSRSIYSCRRYINMNYTVPCRAAVNHGREYANKHDNHVACVTEIDAWCLGRQSQDT